MQDGQPCKQPGCLSHVSHPCEGCGRIAGRTLTDQDSILAIVEHAIGICEERATLTTTLKEHRQLERAFTHYAGDMLPRMARAFLHIYNGDRSGVPVNELHSDFRKASDAYILSILNGERVERPSDDPGH